MEVNPALLLAGGFGLAGLVTVLLAVVGIVEATDDLHVLTTAPEAVATTIVARARRYRTALVAAGALTTAVFGLTIVAVPPSDLTRIVGRAVLLFTVLVDLGVVGLDRWARRALARAAERGRLRMLP